MNTMTMPETQTQALDGAACPRHLSLQFTGFDIETKPCPELVERFSKPYPEFDAAAVKCGNLKDPAKIAAKLADAKADHESGREAYWKNLRDRAALNPFTGQIVVIGLIEETGEVRFLEGSEATILRQFWDAFAWAGDAARKWVFWSGSGSPSKMFDLDYIVTRSRIVGVRIPAQVRSGRFYAQRFVDLAGEFLLYQFDGYLSLTKAAEIFGLYDREDVPIERMIYRKRDDDAVTGENFWQWWEGSAHPDDSKEAQREHARHYLKNDLLHLFHLAPRIL